MKILSITSLFPNCKEPNKGIFILNKLNEMKKYANIEVIAPIPWFPFVTQNRPRGIPATEYINGIKVYHPRFFSIPKFFKFLDGYFFYLSLKKFRKKIKKANIIDAHFGWPDGYGAWLIAKKNKKKISITLQGKDANFWARKPFVKNKISKMLENSAFVTAVSENLKNKLRNKKIKVITNCVDSKKFKPLNKNKSRKKLKIALNKKVFLTVGEDFKRKGFFELAQSFDRMDIQNKLLIIVGYDIKEFKNLQRKISLLGCKDQIKLVGQLRNEKLPIYYSSADIYCLVSYSEGWPNSVMEALACGKPCIVTQEAAGEFITPELGIITNHQNLTDDLEKALHKKWNLKQILDFARRNSWDKSAKKTYLYFKKILAQ